MVRDIISICMRFSAGHLAAISFLLASDISATAATATGSLNVTITIQAECTVVSASDLDFGTHGVIDANLDQTTSISIQCTSGTPYAVGLDAGTGSGATLAARLMTGPASATVQYSLYRDAGRSQVWGDTPGVDTADGTANGSAETLTVYGRVPAQATPGAGTYSDTVAITITY